MRQVIVLAGAVLMSALLGGCSFTHKLTPEPRMDSLPSVPKSPIRAGVYYSPQFSAQDFSRASGSHIYVVPIGAASVRLFDDLYPRVFDKTVKMASLSSEEFAAQGVDVVIAPTLEHFDFRIGMDSDSDRYSVSYRMTLYSSQGVPVASWIVFGNAPSSYALSTTNGSWISDDMTDAAVKFLRGFERDAGPALAAIAKNQGHQVAGLDLQGIVLTVKRADLSSLNAKQLATLDAAGVLALKITARSQAEGGVVVRGSDMRLRLKDGQIIEPSSVSSVLDILEGPSQAGAATAMLTNSAFGLLVNYLEQRSNQTERELQFKSGGQSLFDERTLNKGKDETGIVLFRLPKGANVADGVTLTAWVVNPASAAGGKIEVPFASGFAVRSGSASLPAPNHTASDAR